MTQESSSTDGPGVTGKSKHFTEKMAQIQKEGLDLKPEGTGSSQLCDLKLIVDLSTP